ncbi:MAG: hypothetical protein Q9209_002268 [Squamulea sp. 1 TL-2023]
MPSPPAQEDKANPIRLGQKSAVCDPTRLAKSLATPDPNPHQTVNNHIKLLRKYNDLRDIGTSLMGIIANNRQVQMKRVYEDFHVDEKD